MRSDAIEVCANSRGSSALAAGSTAVEESLEQKLATTLALVLHRDDVPWDRNFFGDLGADSLAMAHFCARVRRQTDLPPVSMRDIYAHPTVQDLAQALRGETPSYAEALRRLLAEVLDQEIALDSDFFDDLGADSMTMAHFCARVRRSPDLPAIAMRDIYAHPTIAGLAAALAAQNADPAPPTATAAPTDPAQEVEASSHPAEPLVTRSVTAPGRAGTVAYAVCGVFQLAAFVAYTLVYAVLAARGYDWIADAEGPWAIYLRSVVFAGIALVAIAALPIVVKWTLVGRWRQQEIPVWSLAYFRFWLVKTVIRGNPLLLVMNGSPLFVLYLRALGAHVGRGVTILARAVPACPDLLTIGHGSVVRKETAMACYRAVDGVIQTGPVTLGANVYVGEKTVLDIGTRMEDGAQLGHSSSLHEGQVIPAGQTWHGSPAQPASISYRAAEPLPCGTARRFAYGAAQLLTLLLVSLPLTTGGLLMLIAEVPTLANLLVGDHVSPTGWPFYRDALLGALVIVVGTTVLGLPLVFTLPRLLNLALKPDRVYPLYGFHYSLHRAIVRLTNVKYFTYLFGDSSYIVHYLRCLGYDLTRVEQTGSNFGTAVVHENPYLASVGSGTMVADGLVIINADYSSSSFKISRARIGAHNFLGNHIGFPSQSKTGDNCLLGTKVMVPIDGPVRQNVGLLGSPSFEIPRSVLRDTSLEIRDPEERRRRLHAKNRHNLVTLALALVARWLHLFGLLVLAMLVEEWYRRFGVGAVAAELVLAVLFTITYFVVLERAGAGFRRLRPLSCSIYDRRFWRHERFWKLAIPRMDNMLAGTPFKNVVSRALGVRLGKRVFDDGCFMPERTLAAVGDDCTLNAGTVVQCHSQEDGAFKSGYTVVGDRCTIGVGALVHYGVQLGEGVILAPDSFVMKGEDVPPFAYWGGNPAAERPALRVGQQDRGALGSRLVGASTASLAGRGGEDDRR